MDELTRAIAAQRALFLERVREVRPRLHRYCSRMTGSPLDGEDLVQEVLARAFFKLPTLQDDARLEPWLFRMAHHVTIDHLRHKRLALSELDEERLEPDAPEIDPRELREALVSLVTHLPPMERACVILKDVLDHPLAEIAEIVGSTLGGVKAAIHRGRDKLASLERATREPDGAPVPVRRMDPSERLLLSAYLERFNARNWEGMIELLRADARLEVLDFADADAARILRTGYSKNYLAMPAWRFALASVNGREEAVQFRRGPDGQWRPFAALRVTWREGRMASVRDYVHVDYLFDGADVRELEP